LNQFLNKTCIRNRFTQKVVLEVSVFFVFWKGNHTNKIVFARRYLGYLVYFTIIFFVKNLKPKWNWNKEETPSSNGVVWAYFLCCWASKSSCILVFHDGFGKKTKIGWAPPMSPSWPAATMIFLVDYFKPNNSFLGHNLRKRLLVLFF
jgi:hypothetical protein